MNRTTRLSLAASLTCLVVAGAALPADARNVRNRSRNNVNVNKNVNVNTHKHVDVDVNHRGGYYGGCCYHDHYHPVATAAAVTATVAVTAAVVGSIVNTLPSGCQTVIVNGFGYQQCGNTWYQPQISGSSTTYVVVNPPR